MLAYITNGQTLYDDLYPLNQAPFSNSLKRDQVDRHHYRILANLISALACQG